MPLLIAKAGRIGIIVRVEVIILISNIAQLIFIKRFTTELKQTFYTLSMR